jgi:hypothetical protein
VAETLPLHCKLAEGQGGLGFDSEEIGAVLSVSGMALLVASVAIFPLVQARSGSLGVQGLEWVRLLDLICLCLAAGLGVSCVYGSACWECCRSSCSGPSRPASLGTRPCSGRHSASVSRPRLYSPP